MTRYLLLFLLFACSSPETASNEVTAVAETHHEHPKNIIFLIGDGMGLSQITLGMYSQGNKTIFEEFPVVGLHKSHAYDNLVTDSAAGATAFACGVKTYNGAIGLGPDSIAVTSVLEHAQTFHMSTGLVATSTIVHATPASFAAHNLNRKNYEQIADDMSDSKVDVMIGGGKKHFTRRKDGRDLMEEMRKNGYLASDFFESEIEDLKPTPDQKVLYLTSDEDPIPVRMGRDYLPEASQFAVNHLNQLSEEGFFLMIEGSQIDWGGHANDQNYIITEYQEFDGVVKNVLEFAKQDGETLVIVTADHETGGLAINKGSTMDTFVTAFTTGSHTADMIPVFAYGPGSETFAGIYENTAIHDKILEMLRHRHAH